jgi:hypothetical protein
LPAAAGIFFERITIKMPQRFENRCGFLCCAGRYFNGSLRDGMNGIKATEVLKVQAFYPSL